MATKKRAKKKPARKSTRKPVSIFAAASKDRSYKAAKKRVVKARAAAKKAAKKAAVAYKAAIRKAKSKKR